MVFFWKMVNVQIDPSWKAILQQEFDQEYFSHLVDFLKKEQQQGKVIYPSGSSIFRAFELTKWDDVRIVILGQDPYHGKGQAHGLAFSVQEGVAIPPSLRNIYQEITDSTGHEIPVSGDLSRWAEQGVLLLNTTLTVEASKPLSHRGQGWEEFTDAVIRHISEKKEGIIFLLRGGHAKGKMKLIDQARHHVLTAPHPSPLSAYRGWFGCGHFVQVNEILRQRGQKEVMW